MDDHRGRERFAAWINTKAEAEQQERIMPTVAKVRVCERIESDGAEQNEFVTSMAERYRVLTTDLPLAGGPALKPNAEGTPALITRLRQEAPWLENAIELLDSQLRVQLYTGRPWVAFRPMLLVGPPGCGKTTLGSGPIDVNVAI